MSRGEARRGSGGVLAPLLIMGGALGAFESHFIPVGDAGLWAILGMAAMMGGTMRSPLTAMVFTLELTHDLDLLPGLLVCSIAAHALTVLLLRRSILTEKVARRGYHVTREYSVDPLTALRVGEVMDRDVPTVPASMKVAELSERIARHDPRLTMRQGIPILDDDARLVGIITRGDVLRALERGSGGDSTVLDAGSRSLVVTYPDEVLQEAVVKMLRSDIGRLPVVDREDPRRLVRYLGRAGVMAAACAAFGLFFAFIYFDFIRSEGGSQVWTLVFSSGVWFLVAGVILFCRRFVGREL